MITVKEYAAKHGKTIQAVHQQMKREKNRKLLEGHVTEQEINGRIVKFLDDEAVRILDHASLQSPIVVVENYETILKQENEELLKKNQELSDKLIAAMEINAHQSDQLIEMKTVQLQLADKEHKLSDAAKSIQNIEEKLKRAEEDLEAVKREAEKAKQEAERLKSRGLFERLFNK